MLSFIRDFIIMNHQKGELVFNRGQWIRIPGTLFLEFDSKMKLGVQLI